MKTLKFNSDYQACAHSFIYAEKNESGENYGRRMFFNNDTIYSYGYHFIIAKKIRNKSGEIDFVLFNSNKASVTTTKQQTIVERSICYRIISVSTDINNFNALNEILQKEKEIFYLCNLYLKARSEHNKKNYYNEITTHLNSINFLMCYYKIKSSTPTRIRKFINLKDKKDDLINILKIGEKNRSKADKRRKTNEENKRIKRIEELKKIESSNIKKWKKGEIKKIYLTYDKNDYLRICENKKSVETTQNISIPIKEAKKAIKLIESSKIIGYKIDEKYLVKSINGILKVGCHNISINEIEQIKNLLKNI